MNEMNEYLLVNGSSELSSVSNTGVENKVRGGVSQAEVMLKMFKIKTKTYTRFYFYIYQGLKMYEESQGNTQSECNAVRRFFYLFYALKEWNIRRIVCRKRNIFLSNVFYLGKVILQ